MSSIETAGQAPLLSTQHAYKYYPAKRVGLELRRRWIRAVDGVTIEITRPGMTVGVVGESGSGKSTTSRLLLGLERPDRGAVLFEGQDINRSGRSVRRRYRAAVKAVFQDPYASLDPRMKIGEMVAEPLRLLDLGASAVNSRVVESLAKVGLPSTLVGSLPRELSGGMRQRVAVARAIITQPRAVVLDEPTSALDVSVRAQILNLLRDIQDEMATSYVLISHDLATMRFMAHEIHVMYAGQVVEHATNEELFSKPLHPYTNALMASALPAHPRDRSDALPETESAEPETPADGCRFRLRCPFAMARCATENPILRRVGATHQVACHLFEGGAA